MCFGNEKWIKLVQDRAQWRASVNTVTILWVLDFHVQVISFHLP